MKLYPTLVAIAAASVLIAILANWSQGFVWDEGIWVDNLRVFEQHGLSKEFLLGMRKQAPGPLWQLIHSLFEPITQLHPARMRLLNFAMALATLGALGRVISRWEAIRRPQLIAFTTLCVPGIALIAGTAMTEIPTLLFALLSVDLTLSFILGSERRTADRLGVAVLAGFFLGVAALGRANFLALAFATPCLMVLPRVRTDWKAVSLGSLLALCVALAISGPVFWTWKAFVPPDIASQVHLSFNPWNAILISIQLTLVVFVLSPAWFRASPREVAAWCLFGLASFGLNAIWLGWEHQSVGVGKVLAVIGVVDPGTKTAIAYATPAAFFTYACFFFVRAMRHAVEECRDVVPLYGYCISALLVVGSVFQTLNFGVRSATQIAPFLAMTLAPHVLTDRGAFPVKLVGLGLGIYFLLEQLAQL